MIGYATTVFNVLIENKMTTDGYFLSSVDRQNIHIHMTHSY